MDKRRSDSNKKVWMSVVMSLGLVGIGAALWALAEMLERQDAAGPIAPEVAHGHLLLHAAEGLERPRASAASGRPLLEPPTVRPPIRPVIPARPIIPVRPVIPIRPIIIP
jgi:hypothetical protein